MKKYLLISTIFLCFCLPLYSKADDFLCPDGKSKCKVGYTCCSLVSGRYGCCDYTDGECCSDHLHCCPGGMKCDVAHARCYFGDHTPYFWRSNAVESFALLTPSEEVSLMKEVTHVEGGNDPGGRCPDGKVCPEAFTCCLLAKRGAYGCCPYKNAMCCSDHIHCCPQGTTCNVTQNTCDVQNNLMFSVPMYSMESLELSLDGVERMAAKLPLAHLTASNSTAPVVCPDRSQCPTGDTCCPVVDGYGCCPLLNATCCSDKVHCCPHGYRCYENSCVTE